MLHWYALQVVSNSELAVEEQLNKLIKDGIYPNIKEVFVPKETVVSYKDKKPIEKIKALYKGYVFLRIKDFDPKLYVNIRERIPKVLKFTGDKKTPQIMTDKDMEKVFKQAKTIEGKKRHINIFEKGTKVFIKEGSFANTYGEIVDFFPHIKKALVEIEVFGRPTEVEIDSRFLDKV